MVIPLVEKAEFIGPSDSLRAVFTDGVRAEWRKADDPRGVMQGRLEVLEACGPEPSDPDKRHQVRRLRAVKAAWEAYLDAALACGLFEGSRATDLRSRLCGTGDDGFRSAFAECLACWFFAGRIGLPTSGEAVGRGARNLDLKVTLPEGDVGVEVKAPYREPLEPGEFTWGSDDDKIAQCLEQANRQFNDETPNILVIVPELRLPLYSRRNDLVKAAYGETVIAFDVNPEKGRLENHRWQFSPQGKFLNPTRPGGKLLKPDGFPAYRRVSAIVCIEPRVVEKYPNPANLMLLGSLLKSQWSEINRMLPVARERFFGKENEVWVDHNILVMHNPYAYHPLGYGTFDEFPQLICDDTGMRWTDGHDVSFG